MKLAESAMVLRQVLAHLAQQHEQPLLQRDDALFGTEQRLHFPDAGASGLRERRDGPLELLNLLFELGGIFLDQELQHLAGDQRAAAAPCVGGFDLLQHRQLADLDFQLLLHSGAVEEFRRKLVEIQEEVRSSPPRCRRSAWREGR